MYPLKLRASPNLFLHLPPAPLASTSPSSRLAIPQKFILGMND